MLLIQSTIYYTIASIVMISKYCTKTQIIQYQYFSVTVEVYKECKQYFIYTHYNFIVRKSEQQNKNSGKAEENVSHKVEQINYLHISTYMYIHFHLTLKNYI